MMDEITKLYENAEVNQICDTFVHWMQCEWETKQCEDCERRAQFPALIKCSAFALRKFVLSGFGYKRNDAPSSPISAIIASLTFGEGGNGNSFVFNFTQSEVSGCSPGVYAFTRDTPEEIFDAISIFIFIGVLILQIQKHQVLDFSVARSDIFQGMGRAYALN